MASVVVSLSAALTCTCSNTITKSLTSPNLLSTPFKFLANDPPPLGFCFFARNCTPLLFCSSPVVARAYAGGDSEDTPDSDDDKDSDVGDEDAYDLLLDSECQGDGIEIEIEKPGKNSRIIRSKVDVQASLQTVWNLLTDYERLSDFIPGLAVSQLLEKRDKFARLFQVGEQNLAFGLKFNAKGTIDCFERDLHTLPFGQRRDIEFKMVEGDFQLFEGKWSIEQVLKSDAGDLQSDSVVDPESQTSLVYIVHVKPKVWLPVRLVEGRLCNEIRTNLSCIRKEAEKVFQNTHSALQ